MAVALGMEDEHGNQNRDQKGHMDVYKEYFQKPFLKSTDNYYKTESEQFLAQNSISDYLRLAERRLNEEERRVDMYMHSQTRSPVSAGGAEVVERELTGVMGCS